MSKKPDLEMNKIFAAILVAGITAMMAGFIAKKLVHPEELEEPAVNIDTSALATAGSGEVKPQVADPILALLADADLERGQKLSKACAACHTFEEGGQNLVGPNLWNKMNAKVGAKPAFAYSDTLKTMGAEGQIWDYQLMNSFLWKPKTTAPGTKMNYIGIKKPKDRAALIAWMRSLSNAPAALPTAAQIAAEAPEPEVIEEATELQ